MCKFDLNSLLWVVIIFFMAELFLVFCRVNVFIKMVIFGMVVLIFFNLVRVVCIFGSFLNIFKVLILVFNGNVGML